MVKIVPNQLPISLPLDPQRLLRIDGGYEVFNLRAPDVPTTCIYTIRPYQPDDKVMSFYFAF